MVTACGMGQKSALSLCASANGMRYRFQELEAALSIAEEQLSAEEEQGGAQTEALQVRSLPMCSMLLMGGTPQSQQGCHEGNADVQYASLFKSI